MIMIPRFWLLVFLDVAAVACAQGNPSIKRIETNVPQECNKPELLENGRPVWVEMGAGLKLGASFAQEEFRAGDPIKLHIWVVNTGDASSGVTTCGDLELFRARGFDLFDSSGRVFPSHDEQATTALCSSQRRIAQRQVWSCLKNPMLPVPAHSCMTRDDGDFAMDLNLYNSLPPGKYTLRLRPDWRRAKDLCNLAIEELKADPADLQFVVLKK